MSLSSVEDTLSLSSVEDARARLRTRRTAPAKPPWHPPGLADFLPGRVIIAFDASLVNTGWVVIRSLGHEIEVLEHGTIRPKTSAVGFMATWERAIGLELGVWDASLVVRYIRDDDVLMAVEAPPVGGGYRTESSLIAGLTVYRLAPHRCAVVSVAHVNSVLLNQPNIKSRERKPAVKAAVACYVPESAGRDWTEHERDALSVGLTRLFDLREEMP